MKLFIQNKGEMGVGVFTASHIAKGTMLRRMHGTLRSAHEVADDMFALQVGDDAWLTSYGDHIDDYINHSCAPNAAFKDGDYTLHAVRDIEPEEEITFDYSTAMNDAHWSMDCLCAASQCRKIILPFHQLPAEAQHRLQAHALHYLKSTHAETHVIKPLLLRTGASTK